MRVAVLATLLLAVRGLSTQHCRTTVKSNSRLGTEDPITPIWTPDSQYGSGLPGPMPSSTIAAFTGSLPASLESAWQWPILSSSSVTTVDSMTSNPIASVSPSVPTQSNVSTLDCGEASLRPTLTITSTCSSTAFDSPSTAAFTMPSSISPFSTFMSQYPPAYPSLPILPHDPTSLTWSSVHSCTSSATPYPAFASKEPINISFYDSLLGLPLHPSSQTKGGTVPSISGPSTKSIPKRPTSTMNFLTLRTSLTSCETLTHKTDPAVITSIMVPDTHCPYPYPRIYCGETMTILVTKMKDKPKTSDSGCPYPGNDILC